MQEWLFAPHYSAGMGVSIELDDGKRQSTASLCTSFSFSNADAYADDIAGPDLLLSITRDKCCCAQQNLPQVNITPGTSRATSHW